MNESTMINRQTGRIEYIDIAKGVLIILVVIGHVLKASTYFSIFLIWLINCFHMPAFFIISGILLNREKLVKQSFAEFAAKKAKRLLVPYVVLELLGGIWQMLLMGTDAVNIKGILYGILTIQCHVGADWFLPTLFIAEMFFIGCPILKTNCIIYRL